MITIYVWNGFRIQNKAKFAETRDWYYFNTSAMSLQYISKMI